MRVKILYFVVVLTTLLLSVCSMPASAQKKKKVSVEYTYVASDNESPEQAKVNAFEAAKVKAIADEFGTIVSESNTTYVDQTNTDTKSQFYSIGGSKLKGEWLKTTEGPTYELTFQDGKMVVRCKVSGWVREIKTSETNFEAKVLRNGTEQKFESEEFRDGDNLYLYFNTPAAGYIAVYYIDAQETAYCLLPYMSDRDGMAPVMANTEYVFFSEEKSSPYCTAQEVDSPQTLCELGSEMNYLYIVFSPNPFVKAADKLDNTKQMPDDLRLPRELPKKDFLTWLDKRQAYDQKMQHVVKRIHVTK